MKKAFSSPFVLLIVLAIAAIGSCSKVCDEGYEGKRCDVEIRAKYEGAWHANDNPGNLAFTDTISKGAGILDVSIMRIFGTDTFNRAVKANVSGNTITIASQKPESGRELYIQGSGTIADDYQTINWSYTLTGNSGGIPDTSSFTGVWTK
jgi:hypothetical protein